MLNPEKIVVYRSQSEKAMDDLIYGGGLFEEGFITKTVATDIVLVLVVVLVIVVLMSRPWRRRW